MQDLVKKKFLQSLPLVYTAYGAEVVIGNILAGQSKTLLGSYLMVFPFIMLLALLGIIVAITTLKLLKKI